MFILSVSLSSTSKLSIFLYVASEPDHIKIKNTRQKSVQRLFRKFKVLLGGSGEDVGIEMVTKKF